MHALVGRVVVHVAHHYDFRLRVKAENPVFQRLHLRGAHLAEVADIEAARQVVDDYHHVLASHLTADGKEATGAEERVLLLGGHIRVEPISLDGEERRIVDKGAVDATAVGTLDMAELVSALAELRLGTQVGKATVVFHFRHANRGAAHAGEHRRAHVAKGASHVVQLV